MQTKDLENPWIFTGIKISSIKRNICIQNFLNKEIEKQKKIAKLQDYKKLFESINFSQRNCIFLN